MKDQWRSIKLLATRLRKIPRILLPARKGRAGWKIPKNPATIYNPNNDLWRHAPQKKEDNSEDMCEISPVPSQPQKENADLNSGKVSLENLAISAGQDTTSKFNLASKNMSRQKLSSYLVRMKPRTSGDPNPNGYHAMPSALFNKQAPKKRDSLYVRQPAMPRFRRPGDSKVKFTPKVYFKSQEELQPNKNWVTVQGGNAIIPDAPFRGEWQADCKSHQCMVLVWLLCRIQRATNGRIDSSYIKIQLFLYFTCYYRIVELNCY